MLFQSGVVAYVKWHTRARYGRCGRRLDDRWEKALNSIRSLFLDNNRVPTADTRAIESMTHLLDIWQAYALSSTQRHLLLPFVTPLRITKAFPGKPVNSCFMTQVLHPSHPFYFPTYRSTECRRDFQAGRGLRTVHFLHRRKRHLKTQCDSI